MNHNLKPEISWEHFEKIDIRIGTVLEAEEFTGLRNPALKLKIDFGPLGIKQSSAQITDLYKVEDLLQKQVIAVLNFPKKQIRNFFSECLVLGIYAHDGSVVLLTPDMPAANGSSIG